MILNDGFHSFELAWSRKRPAAGKELTFRTRDEALSWLICIRARNSHLISSLRTFLPPQMACFRLNDQKVLEETAFLIFSRRLIVICEQEAHQQSSAATARCFDKPVPFPLSSLPPATQPVSVKPPKTDLPIFSPAVDSTVQAAALVAAADRGVAFCPECAKL